MAVGSKGHKAMNMKISVCVGPGKVKNMGKSYDTGKGPLGMREAYQQTGKPGSGSK